MSVIKTVPYPNTQDSEINTFNMRPCTDDDFKLFYEPTEYQKATIQAHKDAQQFWCPDTPLYTKLN